MFSIAFLALLACSATLSAQTLMWNANTEADLAGYIVQYGTQSGNPSTSIDVGNVTSRAITGLTPGSTYYFRVVAYNSSGQQSAPSSQVSYTVPSRAGQSDGHVGVADERPDGGRHADHHQRHELRGGRDGPRRRHAGDGVTLVSATQLAPRRRPAPSARRPCR